jgi:hypothetical protein
MPSSTTLSTDNILFEGSLRLQSLLPGLHNLAHKKKRWPRKGSPWWNSVEATEKFTRLLRLLAKGTIQMTIWTNVKSNNIEALSHSAEELSVKFKSGEIYKYANVPVGLFQTVLNADSVGKIFNQKIKHFPESFPFTLT